MSWWQGTKRLAGRFAGPAFTTFDYLQGKAEGEDDVRAAGGAFSSAAAGWAGATQGAVIGGTIGSVIPVLGTAVGAGIGGILGGLGGSVAGSWAFDRADDLVRGKPNKDRDTPEGIYSGVAQELNQGSRNNNGVALAAGGVAAGVGVNQVLNKGKNMRIPFNPYQAFRTAQVGGIPASTAAKAVAQQSVETYGPMVGKALTHPSVKAGVVIGGGYLINNALGNPIGGTTDALTGGRTNFKANESDELGQQHEIAEQERLIQADHSLSIYDQYKEIAKLQERIDQEVNNPFSANVQGWRQNEREDMIFENNISKDTANFNLKNQMIKGAFDHENAMAATNAQNYWNSAVSRRQFLNNAYSQRY